MNILFLGYKENSIITHLHRECNYVLAEDCKGIYLENADFIISYGYKYLIPEWIIDLHPHKIINLHISYLPYNRGADPLLWSVIDRTPKGVTIHEIDKNIDTGAILCQREIPVYANETMEQTYRKMRNELEKLFIENWDAISTGKIKAIPQGFRTAIHLSSDKNKYFKDDSWHTWTTEQVVNYVGEMQSK